MRFLLFLFMFAVMSSSACGERAHKTGGEPGTSLEGLWRAHDYGCVREFYFHDDKLFQETKMCPDYPGAYEVSRGIYQRYDGTLLLQYVDSECGKTDLHLQAIYDVEGDRLVLTDLYDTLLLERTSGRRPACFPSGCSYRKCLGHRTEKGVTVINNNTVTNNNTNNNTNTNNNENKNVNQNQNKKCPWYGC